MASGSRVKAVLKAVGSLWLAAVLLLLLMVAMGSATVYETIYGTEQAKAAFYFAGWFRYLLVLLGANVSAAIALRYPFRRRLLPFLITHAGILVILLGALLSEVIGLDGRISLAKGQRGDSFIVPGEVITLKAVRGAPATLEFGRGLKDPLKAVEQVKGARKSVDGVEIEVVRYLPDVRWEKRVLNDGPRPHLAMEVVLSGPQGENTAWLVAGEHGQLGDKHADLLEIRDPVGWQQLFDGETDTSKGIVRISHAEQTYDFPLEDCTDKAVPVGETGYTIRVLRYFPHATVGANRTIENASDRPVNPAIEAEIAGPDGVAKKIAFARFPGFHGRAGQDAAKDFKLLFLAAASQQESKGPIEFLGGPTGEVAVRLTAAGSAPVIRLISVGEGIETPWPETTVRLLRRYDRARVQYEALPRSPIRKDRRQAVLLRIRDSAADSSQELWLEKYSERTIQAGGKAYRVTYSGRVIPLGFEIMLNQFTLGYYPGNARIRSYESNVTITDPATGGAFDCVVSMNRPVTFGGFTFYQSSYQKSGNDYATVLSVARDPGRPIVFVGYAAAMLGMVLLLVRRLKNQRGAPPRPPPSSPTVPEVHEDVSPPTTPRALEAELHACPVGTARPRWGFRRTRALSLLAILLLSSRVFADMTNLPTSVDITPLKGLIVQHDGRYMPLDTLARDTIWRVTGSETFQGAEPVSLLLAWVFDPLAWQRVPLIPIRQKSLRKEMELPASRTLFSYQELLEHAPFHALAERVEKLPPDHKLDPLESKVSKIRGKLVAMQQAFRGETILLVPNADPEHPQARWRSAAWLTNTKQENMQEARRAWKRLGADFLSDDATAFAKTAVRLLDRLGNLPATYRPSPGKIETELRYNAVQPYRKAWMILGLAAISAAMALLFKRKWLDLLSGGLILVGFGIFTHGLMQRWTLAGSIPASNMFESLLFLSWGAAGFAFLALFLFRHRSVPLTAAAISAFSLCLADALPIDHFIRPIAPVLVDTIWMSVHVPIIMISYSLLTIGVLIAHVQVGAMAFSPGRKSLSETLDRLLYWYILAGSLLLLVGIVTGSMWAASSWGRYWGWDPKEVWSLVALLGYVTIIHVRIDRGRRTWRGAVVGLALGLVVFVSVGARFAPLSFGKVLALVGVGLALVYFLQARGRFPMAAKSIMAFWLVIMTYVGVNYVLGTGLHSYGFGAGAVASRMCLIGAVDLGILVVLGLVCSLRRRIPARA